MEQYTGFAEVYDMFMDNVPYDEWADYLCGLLTENGIKDGIVAELGCGTGKMTRRLRNRGYDMIGIDISDEMLQIALEKETGQPDSGDGKNNGEILYLCQDMREFELYGSVAAVVSVCDSMNYITDDEDLLEVFKLVHNYLDPGGIFIFDMNTEYYYKHVLGEQTICENREEGSFIWENYYDEENGINEFDMTIYIKNERRTSDPNGNNRGKDESELFKRFSETHYQKAFRVSTVRRLLKQAGMKDIRVFEAMTYDAPAKNTERVYFVSQK